MKQQFYQVGGSLPANSKSYIKREADDILYKYLKEGKYCYVLNARQVGKSSLRVQTSTKLEEEGYSCVNIDLTSIGGSENIEIDAWYWSFVFEIIQQLNLDMDKFIVWWEKHEKLANKLTVIKLFGKIFDEVVLQDQDKKIVIFIDEVDSILGIKKDFSADDFFAVIRTFYNLRSEDERYNRVSFALFGVATPEDLMRDSTRTPFNIAHSVKIEQFKLEESLSLVEGLDCQAIDSQEILEKIFEWTEGTPYLTQKILDYISQNPIGSVHEVDNIVDTLFIKENFKETNISNILTRIMHNPKYNVKMLYLIDNLIAKKIVKSDDSYKQQIYLKLSGLIKEEKGKLFFSNKIYEKIFNKTWLDETIEKIDRPLTKDLQRWSELEKSTSALLKGDVLNKVKEWAKSRDDLSNIENIYLRLSVQEEQENILNEEKRKGQSKIIKLLIPALILVSVLGYFLYKNSNTLEKEKNRNLKVLESLKILSDKENKSKKLSSKENKVWDIKPLKKDENNESEFNNIPKHMYDNSVIEKIKIDNKKDDNDSIALVIPNETQEKFPLLVKMLKATNSQDNSERNYWLQVLPIMTEPQRKELFDILKTEMVKLKAIDLKYDKMEKEAKNKNNIGYIFNDINLTGTIDDTIMDKMLERINIINSNIMHTSYKIFLKKVKSIEERVESKDKYHHFLAKFYFRVKEYDEALINLNKSIEINDKNADVYFDIGQVFQAEKNFDEAIRVYQKAIILVKQLVKKFPTKENLQKQFKFTKKIINIFEITKKYEESIKSINKQISFVKKNKKVLDVCSCGEKYPDTLLKLYSSLAWNYSKNGNFEQAIKLHNKAIELNSEKGYLYRDMAITYADNKKYDKAIKMIEKAILYASSNQEKPGYLQDMSWYKILIKDYKGVIESSLKGIRLSSKDEINAIMGISTNLAHGYLLDNQYNKAKEIYLKYKGSKLDDKLWEVIIFEDFKLLKDENITHSDMDKIGKLLDFEKLEKEKKKEK